MVEVHGGERGAAGAAWGFGGLGGVVGGGVVGVAGGGGPVRHGGGEVGDLLEARGYGELWVVLAFARFVLGMGSRTSRALTTSSTLGACRRDKPRLK